MEASGHNEHGFAFDRLAELSAEEGSRLAALHRLEIMDTPAEPEFDELVQFAAALCRAPVGLITLLDDSRQWFKAAFGVDVRETPRDMAFCNLTIAQNDVLVVPDTTLNPHLAANPNAPTYRFYAGQTILSPEGYALGTLCVLDYVPRELDNAQVAALRLLGKQVNARLLLREQRLALARTMDELRQTQTNLEQANHRLREIAGTDPLTGLHNRRAFEQRLSLNFAQSRRKGHALSVLLMDIDNFKQRNDLYGHDEGDASLRQLAAILQTLARRNDLAVRYGGEEFLLLLPETDEVQAAQVGERVLAAVRDAVWNYQPVTISGGIACVSPAVTHQEQLVTLADEALYAAKRAGKDRIFIRGDASRSALPATGEQTPTPLRKEVN